MFCLSASPAISLEPHLVSAVYGGLQSSGEGGGRFFFFGFSVELHGRRRAFLQFWRAHNQVRVLPLRLA
jgi:16S rRNA C1402 (ribose-2'-O) methylase RsmI